MANYHMGRGKIWLDLLSELQWPQVAVNVGQAGNDVHLITG